MKTIKTLVATAVVFAVTTFASPQGKSVKIATAKADSVSYRLHTGEGEATHDVLVYGDVDILAFGAGSDFPIYEVGKLVPLSEGKHHLLLGGGYISRWEKADTTFVEPFGVLKLWKGRNSVAVKLFTYLPLNGGGTYVGADEISAMRSFGSHWKAGLETGFFKQNPSPLHLQWGPGLRYQKGNTSVALRYQPFGGGEATMRLTVNRSFK